MAMKYTEDQEKAIAAQGKVIVSASAGSGKTAVMIEKIIRLIRSGVHVDEILAVTFTKKAAAQMKKKLSNALIKGINDPQSTPDERKMLKERLAEVPTADISTIHSFCSKLIKTHFYDAETDNSFRIISSDDAEGVALKNQALDELFEEGYEQKDGEFTHLLSVYWRKKSDNALKEIFLEGYEQLRNRADYESYLDGCGQYTEQTFENICEDLRQLFFDKCKYYRALIEKEFKYFEEKGCATQIELCGQLVEWVDEILTSRDYFAVKEVAKPKFKQNRGTQNDGEEKKLHLERLGFLKKRLVESVEKEMEKYASRDEELARFLRSGETARALAVCFKKFDVKYSALKKERGVLDYNDLEHKTLKLLQTEEILQEIRQKYRYVFVDEYQDVNPVQEAITSKVAGENLFLVGDVKQSIYGFRGSKSQFFIDKQSAFEKGEGQSLEMKMNFRSSDAVLDAVNSQFSLAMTEELFGIDYKNKSFMLNGEFEIESGEKKRIYERGSGRARVHFVQDDKEEKEKERGVYSVRANAKKRKGNIGAVARRIRDIIEEERGKQWYDPEKGEYVRVEYSDIAILSRKKQGQIAETVAALAAEGVPITSASAVNVCDYAEVKTLIDLLLLLDNAEQDIPLCSVLLSAIGGLDVNDLTEIRLAYPSEKTADGKEKKIIPFRDACKRYAAGKTDGLAIKLQDFYSYFAKLRKLADVLDTGELLTKVIAETRMEADLLTRENGAAGLRRLRRFIEASSEPEPTSVHEFLARLKDMDYKIEYNENGGENSVKALTMHSSKGLEYPVVIVDNLSQNFRGVDHDEVFVEEKYGLAPRAFDEKTMTKATTVLRVLHEKKESLASIADELNLYYVALTRAKYAIHMIFEKRTVMPDVKYARNCAEFTDFSVWEKFVADHSGMELEKQERDPIAFHPDEKTARAIMSAFLWEYGYAGYENLPVKSSATMLMKGDFLQEWQGQVSNESEFGKQTAHRDDEAEWSQKSETERDKAQEVGTAYHAFLEKFDFGRLYDEHGARLRGKDLALAVEDTLSSLDALVRELLNKEQLIRILSSGAFDGLQDMRLYPEQEFLASLPVSETYGKRADATDAWKIENGEKMLFQGAIDLLAIGEKEVRIIDYKYSDKSEESLKAHYQPQLDLYRKAVASILKIAEEKVRCTIVNIKHCFSVEMG